MEIYDKFYLFDLEKMDVSIVFLGRVVDTRVCILTKRKQLLVTSRFGKNVKLYNITNGCIDDIIKAGHKKEIYQVVVNDPGTLAAVTVVFGPVVLMDLVTHSRMYEISNKAPASSRIALPWTSVKPYHRGAMQRPGLLCAVQISTGHSDN
ncbi:uncharacterized protein LOC127862579 [Dreissena polymorpha]|uniref:uncharacterized protein LOC127862579 n=1 Tax=Dreissena polymorpha TaxID=45954 RepID=UPI002264CD39|nr:uncharacterized protein LOC127862579 [Dreissena polymorpha]XP_052257735.1 uncharacterized protein LOC127862579 [Dreissena polymorpha]